MNYPMVEEVEKGSQVDLCRWYRFLSSPKNSAQGDVMDRISERLKKLGGFTPAISKEIGWEDESVGTIRGRFETFTRQARKDQEKISILEKTIIQERELTESKRVDIRQLQERIASMQGTLIHVPKILPNLNQQNFSIIAKEMTGIALKIYKKAFKEFKKEIRKLGEHKGYKPDIRDCHLGKEGLMKRRGKYGFD